MDRETYHIRPVTEDEPLKEGEIPLTQRQADRLQPMNREQRRAWAKRQRKERKR